MELRRRVFRWEEEQWKQFTEIVNDYKLSMGIQDTVIWKGSPLGDFSVKDFCRNHVCNGSGGSNKWRQVWANLAPHRVEVFVWQILHGRVAVKAELVKWGLMSLSSTCYPLCHQVIETINHVFIYCFESWCIWSEWCREWNFNWVQPENLSTFFQSWDVVILKDGEIKVWKMTFFAVTWSLWLARNDIVFGGKTWDRAQTYELVKLRPRLGAVLKCVKKMRPKVEWTNPVDGSMKFNVDGAASGCPGEAGIGGILKNSAGETKMMFSKSIRMGDSNLAKVLAIKQAFMMFSASNWNGSHSLVIESDSSNAVSWIQAPNQAPWRMRKWILQIEMLKRKVKRWEIKDVRRGQTSKQIPL
ncbi:Uncharacterized protein TCM_041538 [Theobroma cacao]|uniref:Reverse transcriptase zinc-binding domain-containing protein n=1 Tax=Theobroma cacao TaxID=3641 RepID=A0A061GW19_THECC|nr:Uncharacterized protein TCM_041538 [Theobroma cacao]